MGLVLATMTAVAVVFHLLVPQSSWGEAFALGAIVSPPDSVAATQIAGKLGLPRRLVTILGGEGLMNDATALTAYQVAVASVATSLTVTDVAARFLFAVVVPAWASGSPSDGPAPACCAGSRRRSSRTRCC